MIVYAQAANQFSNNLLDQVVNPLIALLAFIAIIYFIVLSIKIIYNSENASKKGNLINQLIWAVIGFTVVFSIWTTFYFVARLVDSGVIINYEEVEFESGDTGSNLDNLIDKRVETADNVNELRSDDFALLNEQRRKNLSGDYKRTKVATCSTDANSTGLGEECGNIRCPNSSLNEKPSFEFPRNEDGSCVKNHSKENSCVVEAYCVIDNKDNLNPTNIAEHLKRLNEKISESLESGYEYKRIATCSQKRPDSLSVLSQGCTEIKCPAGSLQETPHFSYPRNADRSCIKDVNGDCLVELYCNVDKDKLNTTNINRADNLRNIRLDRANINPQNQLQQGRRYEKTIYSRVCPRISTNVSYNKCLEIECPNESYNLKPEDSIFSRHFTDLSIVLFACYLPVGNNSNSQNQQFLQNRLSKNDAEKINDILAKDSNKIRNNVDSGQIETFEKKSYYRVCSSDSSVGCLPLKCPVGNSYNPTPDKFVSIQHSTKGINLDFFSCFVSESDEVSSIPKIELGEVDLDNLDDLFGALDIEINIVNSGINLPKGELNKVKINEADQIVEIKLNR